MRTFRHTPRRLPAIFMLTAIALAACGGSDDDPPDVVVPITALTLTGTAAAGAAIAGGNVESRCNGGSGSAATAADGSYTIALSEGALPCVLRVTAADGTVLHSLAMGSGNAARANLTPVSELVVARLAGGDPAAYFGAFNAAAVPAAAPVQAAVDAVTALLKDAGVDLAGVDVLGGTLVAANGANAGNAFDKALDKLKAALESGGVTLAELRDSVASVGGNPRALNATPSLPVELKLRAAAPNCAALRSGKYRLVFFAAGDGGGTFIDTMTLDAPALKVTLADGEVSSLVTTGDCQYTVASGGEMVVSAAGIGVFRSGERPGFVAAIAIPEQQHPVSATAGIWNYLGLGDTDGAFGVPHLFGGEMTVDAAGKVTADIFCDDVDSCLAETPDANFRFTANASGGFDFDGGRAFAYRAGGGELMIAFVDRDGSFALATRKAARTLPAIGSVGHSWNLTVTPQYTSPFALSSSESTTVAHAVDGASYLRNAVIDFTTGVTRPETVQINTPREGFIHRVPGTVTTSSGGSSSVGEWVALPLRGTGITPVGIIANNQLVLSVVKPTP